MKAFITGIAGFAGSHLAELLLSQRHEVSGLDVRGAPTSNLDQILNRIRYFDIDPDHPESLVEILQTMNPDWIFHLAGKSNVAQSWSDREATLKANFFGTFRLLEAIRTLGIRPSILIVGSGEQYGLVPIERQPIRETEPQWPRSPYAVSKSAQELLCLQYLATDQLDIKLVRPFNHIGPRQQPSFVSADFAGQVAAIELGKSPPTIRVGNLKAIRDFTDVRDMVAAYLLAIRLCPAGEVFNIGSGVGTPVQEILNLYLDLARVPIEIKIEPERFRPVDVPSLVGDCSKFRNLTGWRPRHDLPATLRHILDYWRMRVSI